MLDAQRKIYCFNCGKLMGYITPDSLSGVLKCHRCKSQIQITSDFKDWKREGAKKEGLSFKVSTSGVVDNDFDRKIIEEHNKKVG